MKLRGFLLWLSLLVFEAEPALAMLRSPPSIATHSFAEVVLIAQSADAESRELRALLAELLGREHVNVAFSRAQRFDPSELFADRAPDPERDDGVRVFVELTPDARLVRLYFRGPQGERFLLRNVALTSGLDAVGRELVAQAVASSVTALLASNEGVTQEQAKVEVARQKAEREATPTPTPEPTSPHAQAAPSSEEQAAHARSPLAPPSSARQSPRFFVGARYTLESFGPEMGVAHGPGIELGVGGGVAWLYRLRIAGERWFSQALRVSEFSANVQSNALRLSFDAGVPLPSNQFVVAAVGGGVDSSWIDPGTPTLSQLTSEAARRHVTFVFRPELRYELRYRPWFFAFTAFADIALSRTHYDVRINGARQRLATPWQLRPAANAAFGICW